MQENLCIESGKEVRWMFNFADWQPSEELWLKCLSLLPTDEKERISRFKRPIKGGYITGRHNMNAKSSLVGRLMLRKCAIENLEVPHLQQQWRRTAEGKPFLLDVPECYDSYTSTLDGRVRAGYNMNVTHDGKLVAFVGGQTFVLGVDVMANVRDDPTPANEFFSIFEENFTPHEWTVIKGHESDAKQFTSFFHHWTLKESYIKSIGIGLGFELQRAEFTLDNVNSPSSATVKIDGHNEPNWHFEIHPIPEHNHTISVAYGPLEDSIGSVRASLRYPGPNRPSSKLDSPQRVEFQELFIEDLLG